MKGSIDFYGNEDQANLEIENSMHMSEEQKQIIHEEEDGNFDDEAEEPRQVTPM